MRDSSAANLLFLHALTGLHPGGGTALGVVDLPVQRERHTQWPVIPGSGLKGVLRDACRRKLGGDDEELLAAFGPPPPSETGASQTAKASNYAGALAFTDARLVAFPVRSLRGVFAWVTCPAVLDRLGRDARLLAHGGSAPPAPPPVKQGAAACPQRSDNLIEGNQLVLEEFEFQRTEDDRGVAEWLAKTAVTDEATAERLMRNLVVLQDDDFTHFVRHATEVIARIGLDYETKTARGQALFYEEFLPPETLFYAVALATGSRNEKVDRDAAGMLDLLRDHTPPILQIGADQTIGKGLCAIRVMTSGDGDE